MMVLLMTGCKSKAVTVTSSTRHLDSISTMSSVSARQLDRVETWETIVMRPDTNGRLGVTSRDIVRHTSTSKETAKDTATSHFEAQMDKTDTTKVEKSAESTQQSRRGVVGFGIGIWFAFTALAVLLIVYLIKKGDKKWI